MLLTMLGSSHIYPIEYPYLEKVDVKPMMTMMMMCIAYLYNICSVSLILFELSISLYSWTD